MRVAASRWPPAEVVHQIHDRYLVEIVEALNLCPFARRSREQGRVERPLLWIDERGPSAKDVANTVAETCARNPEVEIILLTFLGWEQHAWARPAAFEDLVRELRGPQRAAASGSAAKRRSPFASPSSLLISASSCSTEMT